MSNSLERKTMFLNSSCLTQRSSSEQCLATSTPPNVGPSQILPFLYLGSQEDALSSKAMQEHHITHIINVSTTGERAPFLEENDDEHFLRIAVNDCHSAKLLPYFEQAYAFIEKARQNNGRVFIHCLAGISRSPALAVSYIMRHLHLTADDAYLYIKARRSYISPNFNFLGQLNDYERQLSSTMKLHTSNPIAKCLATEPPLSDRRRLLQLEGSSSLKREHNHDQPKSLSRPQGFNFDLLNTRRPQSLLSPSSGIAKLTVESPQPTQHASLPPKLLRPNSITLKRSSPTDEATQSTELVNSSSSTNETTNKRVKTVPRSTDSSPLAEKSDLINTFFEAASDQSSSTRSNDSAGETSNLTENRTNSLSSSRELLVS